MSETKSMSRIAIQQALVKPIQEALEKLEIEPNPPHLRRVCRALATLGFAPLLDAGAPPQFVAAQLLEALGHELEHRKKLGTSIVAQA